MNKYPLMGGSILAVVLLVLGSMNNIVGYQTVQTSQQNVIKERINQRDLLFQSIVDIANNKEIQRIILKSRMSRGMFPISDSPMLTKNQLKQNYVIGLIYSKFISKSKMKSLMEKHRFNNQQMQKEISALIEKNPVINGEIIQLQNSECDCENEKVIRSEISTYICAILLVLLLPFLVMVERLAALKNLFEQNPILSRIIDLFSIPAGLGFLIFYLIGSFLNCWY